jgi:hypothetical protein
LKVHLLCAPVIHGDSNLALGLALFGETAPKIVGEPKKTAENKSPPLYASAVLRSVLPSRPGSSTNCEHVWFLVGPGGRAADRRATGAASQTADELRSGEP